MFVLDLTDFDHKKENGPRIAPTEEDEEKRMFMEFNNNYTFEL